jgi:hypothetical protein
MTAQQSATSRNQQQEYNSNEKEANSRFASFLCL